MDKQIDFKNKIIVITGGSRGIGLQIALKLAKDKSKIAILAKTVLETQKYKGTINQSAKLIEEAGGEALPIQCDIREEDQVKYAIDQVVQKWGGIDILINNASMLVITNTEQTTMKRYDLITNVNVRGTFMVSKYCIPYLKKSKCPHILTMSPPINFELRTMQNMLVESIAKYQMSMIVFGMAEEFKDDKICINALWPKTTIDTLAIQSNAPGYNPGSLNVKIMSDAAYHILGQAFSQESTGQFYLDDEVLINNDPNFNYDKYKISNISTVNLTPDLML